MGIFWIQGDGLKKFQAIGIDKIIEIYLKCLIDQVGYFIGIQPKNIGNGF
jgi:hypothetical protein